jgi:DNA-binding transcriptional ArsR family regulator
MSLTPLELAEVEAIVDGRRAALLVQHPLRPRILSLAREPISATAIASALGETRQRVNYHVRQLRRAGFLRAAGRRRRRGLTEVRYVASARAYVLSPAIAGAVAPDIAALPISTEVHLASAEQRIAFAAALQRAVQEVVAAHTASRAASSGSLASESARAFRFVVACYAMPVVDAQPTSRPVQKENADDADDRR